MKIVQTTGIVEKGEIKVKLPPELSDGEVDVIVVAKNEPDEFEQLRSLAKTKGYNSKVKDFSRPQLRFPQLQIKEPREVI